jgi:hypothetical protein
MLDPAMFPFCHEFYVVEKSIEVVVTINGNATAVRIDAVHNLQDDRYCTHAYTEECGFLQPADPVDDAEPRMPIRIWRIWTGFPWTTGQSADDVLRSALSFLRERCQRDAA